MNYTISSIKYCPVKSLSYQSVEKSKITKNLGIENDRIFSFSRGIDFEKAKIIEKFPNERKLNFFLTLKNSPMLNKYNFRFNENQLYLMMEEKEIISIDVSKDEEKNKLSDKLLELENKLLKPIALLMNKEYPFFDTSSSTRVFNSISLININSIIDFEKKVGKKIEHQRFRGNLYIDGLNAWEERNWIGKVIKINDTSFKVERNIPRCVAINLKPNTDDNSLDLLKSLKKTYNHFDMGIYLTALDDGEIGIGDKLIL